MNWFVEFSDAEGNIILQETYAGIESAAALSALLARCLATKEQLENVAGWSACVIDIAD